MDEEIIAQLGLILGQLRFTRRAVEDIERSTSRYGGFAFAAAFSQGARFGEPPMVNGALKVYVVNINELAPGTGIGGFLEGLLGGIGRFFGGFFGGLIGGTISGISLPVLVFGLNALAGRIERILALLGIGTASAPANRNGAGGAATETATGLNLPAMLREIRTVVDAFTGLFQAASTGPEAAARTSPLPSTPAGQRWLAMLQAATEMLRGLDRVVNGLILLVPILIGALAFVITRLDAIKLAFLELLQFILRNVLLLRGVVLVTLFDTLSAAARLAANVLGILATAVNRILTAIFQMLGTLLLLAVQAIGFVSSVLQRTIDALLRWLVDTAFVVLTRLGDTLVFRVVVHIVQLLPEVIPPLYELIRGTPFTGTITSRPIPPPAFPGGSPAALPPFPDFSTILTPAAASFASDVVVATARLSTGIGDVFGSATGALGRVSASLETAAAQEALAARRLEGRFATVAATARVAAATMDPALEAARRTPATGFESIARAYETWLGGGGLSTMLRSITDHFRRAPTTGPAAAATLPGAVVTGAAAERPRATIEIDSVTIEIAPPPPGTTGSTESGAPPVQPVALAPELSASALVELLHELEERGWRPGPGPLITQVA